MEIGTIKHRGLLELFETGRSRRVRRDMIPRIQNVLTRLELAADMESLNAPPGWRVHQLRGDRAGVWSISVSGNWRLTFIVANGEILELDLEDYH